MDQKTQFDGLLVVWIVLGLGSGIGLIFIAAPYGRHRHRRAGPTLENRLGWVLMEAPAPLVFGACFALGERREGWTPWFFLLLWQAHYAHRAFIYPLRLRSHERRMPLTVAGMGFLFNAINGFMNGRYLFSLSENYPDAWLVDARFLAGTLLFLGGYVINRGADRTLRQLRRPGEAGYAIPYGGFYRWVSCPNYLGEIVEWVGWAVATWSLAGLSFAIWTAANLVPRARSHHQWYRQRFADYPRERRRLIPGLW